MKNKIIKFIISFFILMVTGFNSVYAEESLNIESNSLHGSDTAYMSVLDMYKVKLFDSKVSERKEQLKKQKETEKEAMYNSVFSKEITEQLSESEEFEQEVKSYKLFSKPKAQEKIKYINNNKSSNVILITSLIILLCILTGVLTAAHCKKKRKVEEYSLEYNSYT